MSVYKFKKRSELTFFCRKNYSCVQGNGKDMHQNIGLRNPSSQLLRYVISVFTVMSTMDSSCPELLSQFVHLPLYILLMLCTSDLCYFCQYTFNFSVCSFDSSFVQSWLCVLCCIVSGFLLCILCCFSSLLSLALSVYVQVTLVTLKSFFLKKIKKPAPALCIYFTYKICISLKKHCLLHCFFVFANM